MHKLWETCLLWSERNFVFWLWPAGLNNSQCELTQNKPNDPWYCRPCKNDIFPFFGLSDCQFFNHIDSQKLIKPKPSLNKQVARNIICSVCYKKNSLNRGLNCSSCDFQVHKKCTKLKQCDFLFNKITQNTYWECIACQNAKFPFANISNHEKQCLAFNSNFTCKCQTTVSDLVGGHLTLNLSLINSKDRLEYSTAETNNEYFEDLSIHTTWL